MQWILLLFVYCLIGAYNCEDVVFQAKNYPSYSLAVQKMAHGEAVYIVESQKYPLVFTKFQQVKGLVDQNTVSFQLGNKYYLRHRGFYLYLDEQPINDVAAINLFKKDASFNIREQQEDGYKGFIRFESFNYPGYFIRHDGFRVKIEAEGSGNPFKEVSSFLKIPSKVNIETPLLVGYVGVDGSNTQPRIVSEADAAQLKIVKGLTGGDGTSSLTILNFYGKTQYLRHGVGINEKKLYYADINLNEESSKAAATFFMKEDKLHTKYKSFLSYDIVNHYIRSDGNKLVLGHELIPSIRYDTVKDYKEVYFTINTHKKNNQYDAFATVDSVHYVGRSENPLYPDLFNTPTAFQVIPGLQGSGTVSFKIFGTDIFLVYAFDKNIIQQVVLTKDDGTHTKAYFNSAASWYLEEINNNHDYILLRSYLYPWFYMNSRFYGMKLMDRSMPTGHNSFEKGFYYKIIPENN